MARTVKHFSLHRIAGTELRVVADVEAGVLPLIEVEEAVIRGYTEQGRWPHRAVTLFILQNLQPLVRQLRPGAALPPGGASALEHRPVLNAYDLADLAECHVFVNQHVMEKEDYWEDALAIRGLLAHEHAHPAAENGTTRASRSLRLHLSVEGLRAPAAPQPAADAEQQASPDRHKKVRALLALLGEKLCLYAPRELFANEVTIRSGFAEALLHLDRRTMTNAARSVAGRVELRRQLQQQVSEGTLTAGEADVLLLIGDLRGYLDLAIEVAPFRRAGRDGHARELQGLVESNVLRHLSPEVPEAYHALMGQYMDLRAEMTAAELLRWSDAVVNILVGALASKGATLQYQLHTLDT